MAGLKDHEHVVKLRGYGTDGVVIRPSGQKCENLTYIMMDYVEGGLLFDFVKKMGGVGEEAGRDFLTQMLDVMEFMHTKGVVHRDLKLENILLDYDLNLKMTDFGFSTYNNIEKLDTYQGTKTYMAPEIKKR